MISTYSHQPLNTSTAFRVIRLFPACDYDEILRCEIVRLELGNRSLRYEALSYSWELQSTFHDITCGDGTIRISPNCGTALKHLRHQSRKRTLFVDAVCIDQHTNMHSRSERDRQVKLMGRIYAEANRVLIWLGKTNERMGQIFRRLEQLNSQLRQGLNPTSLHGWFAWKFGGSIGSKTLPPHLTTQI